jgi:hypothetical protein
MFQDDPVRVNRGPFCQVQYCPLTPTSSPTSSPTEMSDARSLSLNAKSSFILILGGMIVMMIFQ